MATKPLIRWLLPASSRYVHSDSSEPTTPKDNSLGTDYHVPLLLGPDQQTPNPHPGPRRSSLAMLLAAPTSFIHDAWRTFDDAYMRPVFGGRGFVPYVASSLTIVEDDDAYPTHF